MISIVIIGKNEGKNLEKLYLSLKNITIQKELIYVDSASTDNSILISKEYCNKIISLENDIQLCASAGRYIGTKKASYDWILYLDGDMELENEFCAFLNNMEFQNYENNICGFIGYYKYYYNDKTFEENKLLQKPDQITEHFGGAVMLKKDTVIKSGNWNPSVVANEEIDLCARIENLGVKIFGLDLKMVKHIAKKESNLDTFISLIIPKNRRYYGFGQVLVSQYKHKTITIFTKKKPYPFIYFALFIFSLININFLFFICLFFIYISYEKRWYYNIIYITDIIRGLCGILTYREFEPNIKLDNLNN